MFNQSFEALGVYGTGATYGALFSIEFHLFELELLIVLFGLRFDADLVSLTVPDRGS